MSVGDAFFVGIFLFFKVSQMSQKGVLQEKIEPRK